MSSHLRFPDALAGGGENLHVWNNAAFDHSDGVGVGFTGHHNSPLQPICHNRLVSADQASAAAAAEKPALHKKTVAFKTDIVADVDIDEEIELVEKEIERLTRRLQELRVKKADRGGGRVVPSRFMDPKRGSAATPTVERQGHRGQSLGPLEIVATPAKPTAKKTQLEPKTAGRSSAAATGRTPQRRGLSLGPTEIGKSLGRQIKPDTSKKLCSIKDATTKLGASGPVKNVKLVKDKRRSSSTSPKNRRRQSTLEIAESRKGAFTVGAKIDARRVSGVPATVKPKALFHDNAAEARPRRKSRIVASRYSLAPPAKAEPSSKRQKWSLPEEPDMTENMATPSISKFAELLPKIRAVPWIGESPRDSGCVKRAADVDGRSRSFFAMVNDAGIDEEAEE